MRLTLRIMSQDYSFLKSDLISRLESLDHSNNNTFETVTGSDLRSKEDRLDSLDNECESSKQLIELAANIDGAIGGWESDLTAPEDEPECGQRSPPKLYGVDQEPVEDELIDHEYETDYSVYENKTGLAEDMKFLASMPELCDVTFLVGETREPVCAVRSVLAARSR